jgi:hypothetical protein
MRASNNNQHGTWPGDWRATGSEKAVRTEEQREDRQREGREKKGERKGEISVAQSRRTGEVAHEADGNQPRVVGGEISKKEELRSCEQEKRHTNSVNTYLRWLTPPTQHRGPIALTSLFMFVTVGHASMGQQFSQSPLHVPPKCHKYKGQQCSPQFHTRCT